MALWPHYYNREIIMKKLTAMMVTGLLLSSVAVAKDWTDVRLGVDAPYKPFEYKTPDGELTGFEIDLGNEVCKRAQWKCTWVVQSWDGIVPGLLARKYDAIFSSMSITEERKKKVLFSEPYYNTPSAWFSGADLDLDVTNKSAFKSLRIGVQRGTVQDTYATDELGSKNTIKRYSTSSDLLLDLEGGRLDLVLLDFPVGDTTLLIPEKKSAYKVLGDTFQLGNGMGVAMRKRDKDLAQTFNTILNDIKTDGTYEKIQAKYFNYSIKM